jgi:hypothetical protein
MLEPGAQLPSEAADELRSLLTYLAVAGLLGDVPAALLALALHVRRSRRR